MISPTSNEQEIVRRSIKGDRQAQQMLYGRYAKAMYHTALRILRQKEEAEDVLQESFIKVFKHLKTFREEASLSSWIKRIVINECFSSKRKKKIQLEELTEIAMHPDDNDDPLVTQRTVAQLHNAILNLPDGSRKILSLYLFEGLRHAEIAKILDISESTSKTQYMRAKRLLKTQIKVPYER